MIQFKLSDYVYPRKLNWAIVIQDIEEAGISAHKISELVGAGWSSFQKWRRGVEPRHSIGISLLILHTRYCGEDLTNQRITEAE